MSQGGSAYADARDRALRALTATGAEPTIFEDLVERYAQAVQMVTDVREAWWDAGKPLTTMGGATGATEVPHPLVKMLADTEKSAASAGEAVGLELGAKRRGRPAGAVSAPDRTAKPRIRRVK